MTETGRGVFFLFSCTKIGRSRSSINDRYAISVENILRSYVVRYFLQKFIAGCPSVSLGEFKKKGKKCVGAALVIPEIMCTFVCFQWRRPCRLLGGY